MWNTEYTCNNVNCKCLPEYTVKILSTFHIRENTTVAIISMGDQREIYCCNCIDEIYDLCKSTLNKKLWAFH